MKLQKSIKNWGEPWSEENHNNIMNATKEAFELLNRSKMSLWQKIKLYFNYCPTCNSKLYRWSYDKWKCIRCLKNW
jgi:hypothetical protein